MNFLLASLTFISIAICGPESSTVTENLLIRKNTNITSSDKVIYKKVPTKWTKIPKKAN